MANTTITVNVAESQNYLATSETISVTSSTKQAGYITLSTNSVTISGTTGTTSTVTITSNSGGTLSAVSSDTSKVTASLSGTTITLTAVDSGSATITVSVGETSTYTSATATISVTASVIVDPVPNFETCTEQELLTCIRNYYSGEITLEQIKAKWSVGMTRYFSSTYASDSYVEKYGGDTEFMLVQINEKSLRYNVGSKSKALLTLMCTKWEKLSGNFFTGTTSNMKYPVCGLRDSMNTTVYNSFSCKSDIKEIYKVSTNTSSSESSWDKVWVVDNNDRVTSFDRFPAFRSCLLYTSTSRTYTGENPSIKYLGYMYNSSGTRTDVYTAGNETSSMGNIMMAFCL